MPDGSYRLGSLRVTVAGGVARLADDPGGAIAGSTATLGGVVWHAIAAGVPVPEVAAAASTTPARVLGLGDGTGALTPGRAADLVICDDDFRPCAVMRQGTWLTRPAWSGPR
jgi:N-acetylglucosamine-6-phosphate deacetylase